MTFDLDTWPAHAAISCPYEAPFYNIIRLHISPLPTQIYLSPTFVWEKSLTSQFLTTEIFLHIRTKYLLEVFQISFENLKEQTQQKWYMGELKNYAVQIGFWKRWKTNKQTNKQNKTKVKIAGNWVRIILHYLLYTPSMQSTSHIWLLRGMVLGTLPRNILPQPGPNLKKKILWPRPQPDYILPEPDRTKTFYRKPKITWFLTATSLWIQTEMEK